MLGKRAQRIVFVMTLSLLLAAAVGGAWIWRESDQGCETARALVQEATNFRIEAEEAARDPFLDRLFEIRKIAPRIEFQRELSRALIPLWLWPQVTERGRTALRGYAQNPKPAEREAIARLGAGDMSCIARSRAPATEPSALSEVAGERPAVRVVVAVGIRNPPLLHAYVRRLHEDGMRFLADEAPAEARQLEHDWGTDAGIYCRSRVSLTRLEEVRRTQEEACKSHPAKYTLGCGSEAASRLQREIDQLQDVKGINERKLRTKWGPKLYARIRCG